MASDHDDVESLFEVSDQHLKKVMRGRTGNSRTREAAELICTVQNIAFRNCPPTFRNKPWHFFLQKEAERTGDPPLELVALRELSPVISGEVQTRARTKGPTWDVVVRILRVQAESVDEYRVLRDRVAAVWKASFRKNPPPLDPDELWQFGQGAIEDLVLDSRQLHDEIRKGQQQVEQLTAALHQEQQGLQALRAAHDEQLDAIRESHATESRGMRELAHRLAMMANSAKAEVSDLQQKLHDVFLQATERANDRDLLLGLLTSTVEIVARFAALLELNGLYKAETSQHLARYALGEHEEMFCKADPHHRAISRYLSVHYSYLKINSNNIPLQTVADRVGTAEEVIERLLTAYGPLPAWPELSRRVTELLQLTKSDAEPCLQFIQHLYDARNAATTTENLPKIEDPVKAAASVLTSYVSRDRDVEQKLAELDNPVVEIATADEIVSDPRFIRRLWRWMRRRRMQKRIAKATLRAERLQEHAERLEARMKAHETDHHNQLRTARQRKRDQLLSARMQKEKRAAQRVLDRQQRREKRIQAQLGSW